MITRRFICVTFTTCVIAAFSLGADHATAQLDLPTSGYGIRASTSSFADCPSFCTGTSSFTSDGGEFSLSASTVDSAIGTARASGFYDASSNYLPTLKAYAEATPGGGSFGGVFGSQAYQFDGDSAKTITIDFELDTDLTFNAASSNPDTNASARVEVYDVPFGRPEFITDFGTLLFESSARSIVGDSIFLNTNGSSTVGNSVSFEVEPGDVFFVAARLGASAERGGLANAENTFTATFADPTNLNAVAVTNSVPEPTSLALLALGGLTLGIRRRKTAV